ncbi:BRCA1-associated protein [Dirofilaria immitis]|nr:BRCA1-associated protein [Dirofilaria immitis]
MDIHESESKSSLELMNKVTPITIRLEIQAGAPFIEFEFTGSNEIKYKTQLEKKLMAEGEKYKDVNAQSKIEDDSSLSNATAKTTETVEQSSLRAQCLGSREYTEVTVQTFTKDEAASNKQKSLTSDDQEESVQTMASGSSLSSKANEGSEPSLDPVRETSSAVDKNDCSILCMLGVPSILSCRELLRFVAPSSQYITAMKVIRDSTPNQYMTIIYFRSPDAAVRFYDEYNGVTYNAIEPEECCLVFVEKIESVHEEAGGSLPVENMTELPTCAVCLERMDDGVLTILCNHTFHAQCLEQWADTTCPVCRYSQTPELVADQKCSVCGKTTDLWICLVCGNIGCGRYVEGHAYRHFETTSHTFTLEIGGERVWDYAGDNYVHRLIQSSPDGKMVEYRRSGGNDSSENSGEKLESIQVEYACLLTSQLEYQRIFYENKMNEQERLFSVLEKHNQAQVLGELEEERTLNKLLRSDQEKWSAKLAEMEAKNISLNEKYAATVNDLNEQIRDLMMHFEAETKIQNALEMNKITEQEVNESSVTVADPPQHSSMKSRRRKKK